MGLIQLEEAALTERRYATVQRRIRNVLKEHRIRVEDLLDNRQKCCECAVQIYWLGGGD